MQRSRLRDGFLTDG